MSRIVAIIQARMASRRLPGKVLMDICGKPMLQHVVERTHQGLALIVDADINQNDPTQVIIATGLSDTNNPIRVLCKEKGWKCVSASGSEDDVLGRFHAVLLYRPADLIFRVTGDCPLIEPAIFPVLAQMKVRYSAFLYPDGMEVECFTRDMLEEAHANAKTRYEREHVTTYMRRHAAKLSVDTEEDLRRVRLVMASQLEHSTI